MWFVLAAPWSKPNGNGGLSITTVMLDFYADSKEEAVGKYILACKERDDLESFQMVHTPSFYVFENAPPENGEGPQAQLTTSPAQNADAHRASGE